MSLLGQLCRLRKVAHGCSGDEILLIYIKLETFRCLLEIMSRISYIYLLL